MYDFANLWLDFFSGWILLTLKIHLIKYVKFSSKINHQKLLCVSACQVPICFYLFLLGDILKRGMKFKGRFTFYQYLRDTLFNDSQELWGVKCIYQGLWGSFVYSKWKAFRNFLMSHLVAPFDLCSQCSHSSLFHRQWLIPGYVTNYVHSRSPLSIGVRRSGGPGKKWCTF